MRIGVIVAMDKEMELLLDEIDNASRVLDNNMTFVIGKIGGIDVVAMKCGIGKVNAAVGTTLMVSKFAPDAVINTGVAGAGDSSLAMGDVVVGERVAYHDVWCGPETELGRIQGLPHYFEADKKLVDGVPDEAGIHKGLICSGDWFVDTTERALAIKRDYPDVLALDMESGSIAQVCHVMHVPFMSLRVISDSPMASHDNTLDYTAFWQDAPRHTFAILKSILSSLR